jgi:hypothetical protein
MQQSGYGEQPVSGYEQPAAAYGQQTEQQQHEQPPKPRSRRTTQEGLQTAYSNPYEQPKGQLEDDVQFVYNDICKVRLYPRTIPPPL